MKTKASPAIAAGLTEKIDALAAKTGCDREQLANILIEYALAEVRSGRLSIKPISTPRPRHGGVDLQFSTISERRASPDETSQASPDPTPSRHGTLRSNKQIEQTMKAETQKQTAIPTNKVAARIRRKLKPEGRRLCRSNAREVHNLGDWHTVNDRNCVEFLNVDLEAFAREIGCLAKNEVMVD